MTNYVRRLALTAISVLGLCLGLWADTLYLRNGEQQSGRLEGIARGRIVFETPEGANTFTIGEVSKVQLQQSRRYDDVERTDQITDPDLKACIAAQPTEADFPAAGSVTLLNRRTFDLSTPGVVVDRVRVIQKVLRQRGEDTASTSVWYFEDTDTPEIDFALTVTPDGRVLHLSDAALKNESLYAQLPAYRRFARYRFAGKEPRPGSILDVQYTVQRRRSGPFDPFFTEILFQDDEPVLRQEVELIVPENREREVATAVDERGKVEGSREVSNGMVHLKWVLNQSQPGIVPEPWMPPRRTFAPSVVLGERASWEELAAEYAKALAALAPLPDDLAAKARDLATEQAIHSFVARSIRTVPVPYLHYRVVPHPPGETGRQGMANELDKNFLYFKMLEAAGVPCRFALVRARTQGPLTEDVPSLKAFDRSAVFVEEPAHFTSAQSDVLPYRTLPGSMQQAPALVVGGGGEALRVTDAAGLDAEADTTEFEATLRNDGTLDLTITFAGCGNAGAGLRALKDYDQQRLRDSMQQLVGQIHPGAVLGDFTTTDLADLTLPPKVTLHCRIAEYATTAGDDILLFTLPGLFYDARNVGRPEREHGFYWDYASLETATGIIHLPEGFSVYAAPKDAHFRSSTARYRATVQTGKGTLRFEDRYERPVLEAPHSAYPEFKASQEIRANIPRQRIILMRR